MKESTVQSDTMYTCPMHAEVRGRQGEKCPKCGMELVPVSSEAKREQLVALTTTPEKVVAGQASRLGILIQEKGSVIPLDIAHEKKMHLIVVNENLSWFNHLHPEEQANGSFQAEEIFPAGGNYLLFVDYKPTGLGQAVKKIELKVEGNKGPVTKNENKSVAQTDGYTITLENANDLMSNRAQSLRLSVVKNGKKLTSDQFQQYLGAIAHIVIINQQDKDYLHVHPEAGKEVPILGETEFGKAGMYRMWLQFKIDNKVQTVDFTIEVKAGAKKGEATMHSGHQH